MSQNIVAKRYAEALFLSANEQNKLNEIRAELKAVYDALVNHSDFLLLLKNPKLTKEAKKDLVKDAFSSCSQIVINTLFLLIDRKREEVILEIIENYFERANEAQGLADAKVYSVRPLTADEEKALSESFAKTVGKKELHITNIVDTDLLGGVKLRIGNTIFDGSVKGKLDRIERQLVSVKR
ncbi:F0F1 ATP synthase subunit delta [Bacillus solimangrovi]|uniref:ATP synthase subunit delta n=1 Tax=Bacillus solimangrovi TaxID=1305675 RepID=A0A1E5LGW8_9BACI|nr:F0F1 ATP synthase subunit delta [Bacillus solimangrovi]OEH93314.1 F0F1 ATP synthase subunit delta [Bacillus solimangrovi]